MWLRTCVPPLSCEENLRGSLMALGATVICVQILSLTLHFCLFIYLCAHLPQMPTLLMLCPRAKGGPYCLMPSSQFYNIGALTSTVHVPQHQSRPPHRIMLGFRHCWKCLRRKDSGEGCGYNREALGFGLWDWVRKEMGDFVQLINGSATFFWYKAFQLGTLAVAKTHATKSLPETSNVV